MIDDKSKSRAKYFAGNLVKVYCDQCGQTISAAAKICPYCKSEQPPEEERVAEVRGVVNNFATMTLKIGLGLLIFMVLLFWGVFKWIFS